MNLGIHQHFVIQLRALFTIIILQTPNTDPYTRSKLVLLVNKNSIQKIALGHEEFQAYKWDCELSTVITDNERRPKDINPKDSRVETNRYNQKVLRLFLRLL